MTPIVKGKTWNQQRAKRPCKGCRTATHGRLGKVPMCKPCALKLDEEETNRGYMAAKVWAENPGMKYQAVN